MNNRESEMDIKLQEPNVHVQDIQEDHGPVSAVDDDIAPALPIDDDDDDDPDIDYLIKFEKPFKFEGKEYDSVDLSGLEDMKGSDMISIERQLGRSDPTNLILKEMSVAYATLAGAKATGLPVEFFEEMSAKEMNKVKTRVMAFFYGED